MGRSKYPGGRRNGLSCCIGSYKLGEGENEIGLPEWNGTERYSRIGKRRFMIYNGRVLEHDRTLDKKKKDALFALPRDVRKALVTTQTEGDHVSYKVLLGEHELEFREEAKRPRVECLGSYSLDASGRTFRLPKGSRLFLVEKRKIKFYPEGSRKIGKLMDIPGGSTEVKVTITNHGGRYKDYQFNWRYE
jgi:hypothetical protein